MMLKKLPFGSYSNSADENWRKFTCIFELQVVMVTLIWLVVLATLQTAAELKTVFEWEKLRSRYPDRNTGHLVKEHGIPFSMEIWQNMVFLAVPRWRSGVAASLSFVYVPTGDTPNKSPVLRPYPSWSWHNMHALIGNSNEIQNLLISPYRVRADTCNRLWVLDSGVADILGVPERISPARLLIFQLETRNLLHIASLPDTITKEKSLHTNFVVDVSAKNCEDAFAFIVDVGDPDIVVYDFSNETFWSITHPQFYNEIDSSNTTGDFFGLALSCPVEGDSMLYLQDGKLSVSTAALKTLDLEGLQLVGETDNNSASGASDMDRWTDIIFYTKVTEKAVGCCDTMRNCTSDTEGQINTTLFPRDVRVDLHGNLWILQTRTLSRNNTPTVGIANYRIVSGSVQDLTKNLSCFASIRKHFDDNGSDTMFLKTNVTFWSVLIIVSTGLLNT